MKTLPLLTILLCLPWTARLYADTNTAVDPLKTRTFHIAVADNVGYLSVTVGLKIVDLTDPAHPVPDTSHPNW